jgi:hypothetical protein
MSTWNKEAVARLPELEYMIGHLNFDSPMMLWIELRMKFDQLCEQRPQDLDLLRRIWGYADWCLTHPSADVRTAVVAAFCEHLLDARATRETLPEIMTKCDFIELRPLLLPHSSEGVFEAVWQSFR